MEILSKSVTQPLPALPPHGDRPTVPAPVPSGPPGMPEAHASPDERRHALSEAAARRARSSELRLESLTPPTEPAAPPMLAALLATDPHAEQLRANGQLNPEILAALTQLATQPLAEGLDRDRLLATALANLADPASINQGDRQTCAATVVQAMLALSDPVEYLRLVAGLASPDGTVTLADGTPIARDEAWQLGAGKSPIDQLIQPAFMRVATESYDQTSDSRATADGRGQGLYADEQDALIAAATGQRTVSVFETGPAAMAALTQALKGGQAVSAILRVPDPATGALKGHAVLIEGIQGDRVTLLDPARGRRTLSVAEFRAQLQSLSLPERLVAPELRPPKAASARGLLAGWAFLGGLVERVSKAVERVVAPIVQALAPVVNAVSQAVTAVEEAVTAVHHAVSAVRSAAFEALRQGVTLAMDFWKQVGNGLRDFAKQAAEFWEDYGTYLVIAAQLACAVIPGLQVVSIALAAVQAMDGAKLMADGLSSGDWKKALAGVAAVAGGLAGGAGALGAKAFGGAALQIANVANKVSKVAHGVAGTLEALESGNPGKLLGAVAGTLGNGAELLGRGADETVVTLTRISEQAASYATRAEAAYQALVNGNLAGAFDTLAETAGMDPEATRQLSQGLAFAQALSTGDHEKAKALGAELLAESGLGARLADDETLRRAASTYRQAMQLKQAMERGDLAAATRIATGAATEAGLLDESTARKTNVLAARTQSLADALQRGDQAEAGRLALDMAVDYGVLSDERLQQARKLGGMAQRIHRALADGDVVQAAKLLGLPPDSPLLAPLEEATQRVAPARQWLEKGQALHEALAEGDLTAAAAIVGELTGRDGMIDRQAIEAAIRADARVREAQALAERMQGLRATLDRGDFVTLHRRVHELARQASELEGRLAEHARAVPTLARQLAARLVHGENAASQELALRIGLLNGVLADRHVAEMRRFVKQAGPLREAILDRDVAGAAALLARPLAAVSR